MFVLYLVGFFNLDGFEFSLWLKTTFVARTQCACICFQLVVTGCGLQNTRRYGLNGATCATAVTANVLAHLFMFLFPSRLYWPCHTMRIAIVYVVLIDGITNLHVFCRFCVLSRLGNHSYMRGYVHVVVLFWLNVCRCRSKWRTECLKSSWLVGAVSCASGCLRFWAALP